MSTKFVPFTTRPASTSRHGITRLRCTASALVEDRLRLADRERLLVQGLADDHAREVDLPQADEPAQVVERADAAGVQEAPAHDLGDAPHLVEVDTGEHPVALDVRVDEL